MLTLYSGKETIMNNKYDFFFEQNTNTKKPSSKGLPLPHGFLIRDKIECLKETSSHLLFHKFMKTLLASSRNGFNHIKPLAEFVHRNGIFIVFKFSLLYKTSVQVIHKVV